MGCHREEQQGSGWLEAGIASPPREVGRLMFPGQDVEEGTGVPGIMLALSGGS